MPKKERRQGARSGKGEKDAQNEEDPSARSGNININFFKLHRADSLLCMTFVPRRSSFSTIADHLVKITIPIIQERIHLIEYKNPMNRNTQSKRK
ncbi:hypothetical protein SAMN05192532_102592 [Alteribacillus iranensis]|uniref:Uncharacterized protein n=1 Tax=Alteribacillus iranensis TaxID=930128 RepID=A0A1I2BZL9_9BACI|nr:hypothetical protein SAMN05192532_102592 [Alteribacillus iranensis]